MGGVQDDQRNTEPVLVGCGVSSRVSRSRRLLEIKPVTSDKGPRLATLRSLALVEVPARILMRRL